MLDKPSITVWFLASAEDFLFAIISISYEATLVSSPVYTECSFVWVGGYLLGEIHQALKLSFGLLFWSVFISDTLIC